MKSTTLYYILTAALTFGATYLYFNSKEKTKTIDPPKESKIKTYPITQFFKFNVMKHVDSPSIKENFLFYTTLDREQTNLALAFPSDCGSNIPPEDCAFSVAKDCVNCRCCGGDPTDLIKDPKEPEYRIAAFEENNPHFRKDGKELNLSFTSSNGIRIYTVPENTRINGMDAIFNKQLHSFR